MSSPSAPRASSSEDIDGKVCEPIERVVVDVPSESIGAVIEKLGSRKGEFVEMLPVGSRTRATFFVPERGLFGYRNEFLTDTKGEGIMSSVFERYEPCKGEVSRRGTGSLVAWEHRRGRHLRPLQRAGARHALHRPRHPGLRRHGRRPEPQERGHPRQRLPPQAAHQHARRRQRRGPAPHPAAGS